MIHNNAIAHKNSEANFANKKFDDRKRRVDDAPKMRSPTPTTAVPLCLMPATENYAVALSGTKVNTLFTSHNWGNKK